MKEKIVPIITEVGKIYGRDAIYLDKVNVINEMTFELNGEFNTNLCSNLNDEDIDKKYKIIFENVHMFKMIELDFDEIEYHSSFDIIENSSQIAKLIKKDRESRINKIDENYKHFVFRTYDTVFEIIGKDFKLYLL